MNSCGSPACGEPQRGSGHPRRGWVNVRVAGRNDKGLWYCSAICVAYDLTRGQWTPRVAEVPHILPPHRMSDTEALALLSVLGGQPLTVMTATEERVRRALEHACERLLERVHASDARDRRDRTPMQADALIDLLSAEG